MWSTNAVWDNKLLNQFVQYKITPQAELLVTFHHFNYHFFVYEWLLKIKTACETKRKYHWTFLRFICNAQIQIIDHTIIEYIYSPQNGAIIKLV